MTLPATLSKATCDSDGNWTTVPRELYRDQSGQLRERVLAINPPPKGNGKQ